MKKTIAEMMATVRTLNDIRGAFGHLWNEAENYGLFFDEKNMNNTVYEGWIISEYKDGSKKIVFEDYEGDTIEFLKTGTKYWEIDLKSE